MKKIILISIILIFLTGCGGLFNLNNFAIPDDIDFLNMIESLQTPEEICRYMADNFEFEDHAFKTLTPYELFILKKGDCDDFSAFATFIAHYHGYEVYQIKMEMSFFINHAIGVFKEGNCYNVSNTIYYLNYEWKDFEDIMNAFVNWKSYIVYDYNMNIVEKGYNN